MTVWTARGSSFHDQGERCLACISFFPCLTCFSLVICDQVLHGSTAGNVDMAMLGISPFNGIIRAKCKKINNKKYSLLSQSSIWLCQIYIYNVSDAINIVSDSNTVNVQ